MLSAMLLAALGSALFTALAVDYGRHAGLIDLPGQRRSHQVPTPRGGGIGIVIGMTVVLAGLGVRGQLPQPFAMACIVALLLVALIGWWDDHRALPARWRLLVQGLAALAVVSVLPIDLPEPASSVLRGLLLLALLVAINFCNFMDGINGLAASQAALLGGGLAGMLHAAGSPGWALVAAALAAACLGFLPFNLPRARIFLGDVGSGALGLLVGLLLLVAWTRQALPLGAVLLLPSAFLLDAGLTLVWRILRGRRWTRPHREHLYQWLVRSGASHSAVSAGYGCWTLGMLLIAWCLVDRPAAALLSALVVYGVGAALWVAWRRQLVRQRRRRRRT